MRRISLLLLFFVSFTVYAQESRSTLTGRVTDSSGAVVPKAEIDITDSDTGAKTVISSNNAGEYTAPFLAPGTYEITVTAPGFRPYLHLGINLQTEQTVTENVALEIGSSSQSVTIHASAPLIDTATASTGQVLNAQEVEDLPSNGRAPLGFAHLEYGAVAKGKHSQSQVTPFDNSTADDFSLGGGNSGSNEYLMNGIPDMEDSSRTAGFSPELDAVEAVRVDEFEANAANGDTSGGTINITTKAGTNVLHGSASEYYEASALAANPYFTPAGTKVPSTHFNQFAATVGGPVVIPHLYNGHNKLFFFYAYEGYVGASPATTITSVPTAAERTGDFSALLSGGSSFQLYNPNSGSVNSNGVVTRNPIPGNVLANAGLSVNPIAQAYLANIPMPNYSGPSTQADGENNYFADDPTVNNYFSNQGRIDYNISNSNKIFFEGHRSNYTVTQSDIFKNELTGTKSDVILWGGQVDDVQNFSPTLNLETRLGFSRYDSTSDPKSVGTNPDSLGFPNYISQNSTIFAIPYMQFEEGGNSSIIPSLSGEPGNSEYYDNIQFFASLNKTWGRHTIKIGPDIRVNKDSVLSPGYADGLYQFYTATGDFVTSGTTGPAQPFGGSFALFDLGLPTAGQYSVNTKFQYNNWYFGAFAQDDWKVLPNFTVSMGLRLEHETPVVESNNQMVTGWNPNIANAVTAPAAAAYAAHPNALLPVSDFSATGGVIYASPSNRSPYSTAPLYVSPRIGFAYSPEFSDGKMAIRGGFGIYDNPFNDYDQGQTYGYSQTTNFVPTTNNSLSPATTLSNPYPATNPIQQPFGSSLGINTNLGSSIVFYAPIKVPYAEKWSLDVQQQFGRNWLVEAGYIGVHQVHLSYSSQISSTPLLPFLSRSPAQNPALTAELGGSTTNPFYGIIPGPTSSLNTSKTISVASLLQAYPEYSSVTEELLPGASANFNAFMVKVTKRLSNGLQFNMNYVQSRQLGASSQLNAGGPLWYGETTSDFPFHLSFMGIYQLPFGKGHALLNNSKILDELIGGYTVTGIYQALSGTPLSWGNVNYSGNFSNFNNQPHKTNGPSFNTAGFATASAAQPNAYNYRTFPEYLLRSDPTNNFDFSVLKDFVLYNRIVLQPRVDAFNAFNHPQFSSANVTPTSSAFGDVTSQLNSSRQLQGGVHILF